MNGEDNIVYLDDYRNAKQTAQRDIAEYRIKQCVSELENYTIQISKLDFRVMDLLKATYGKEEI